MNNDKKAVQLHPLCKLFPEYSEDEFEGLRSSIEQNGQIDPTVLLDGQILDGRHGYRACLELGIVPKFITFEEIGFKGTPLDYVLSKNLHRRHLTTRQRAAVAADIANMRQGERTDLEPCRNSGKVTQAEAAKTMGVSRDSVQVAKKIREESSEAFEEVRQGKMSLNAAQKEVKSKKDASPTERSERGNSKPSKTSKDKRKPAKQVDDGQDDDNNDGDVQPSVACLFEALDAFMGDESISDEQRVPVCMRLVRAILEKCFTDNDYRKDYLRQLDDVLAMHGMSS